LEGETPVVEYVYNGLNQRIKKILPTGTKIFHYDLQGHLVAETTEGGQTLTQYFYLGDQPLAMIRLGEAESLYYYHNDHLGTPQILTNDGGTVSWKAVYTPFGEAEISIGTVENPFRFPGQYYDQETGLHYNWNRYYDSNTGRYQTPDPIGLEGGINLFSYVAASNPVGSADPLGLYECTYYIREHRMICTPNVLPHPPLDSNDWVSGNNNSLGPLNCICQNNPDRTNVLYRGPIPEGDYIIGPQRPNSSRRDLMPSILNNMYGRINFQIHGCRIPAECSEGCIAATRNALRDRFNYLMRLEEGNNRLHVIR
jgi:RHS repeat-associated protein